VARGGTGRARERHRVEALCMDYCALVIVHDSLCIGPPRFTDWYDKVLVTAIQCWLQ